VPTTPAERALAFGTLFSTVVLVLLVAANWELFQTATPPAGPSTQRAIAAVPERAPDVRSTAPAPDDTRVGQTAATRPTAPATLELSAVGGPTWLEVRAGGEGGEQLHFDMVPAGATRRYGTLPVWVRAGAADRLVIRLAGARVGTPSAEGIGSP
jgi:hypothetical protein